MVRHSLSSITISFSPSRSRSRSCGALRMAPSASSLLRYSRRTGSRAISLLPISSYPALPPPFVHISSTAPPISSSLNAPGLLPSRRGVARVAWPLSHHLVEEVTLPYRRPHGGLRRSRAAALAALAVLAALAAFAALARCGRRSRGTRRCPRAGTTWKRRVRGRGAGRVWPRVRPRVQPRWRTRRGVVACCKRDVLLQESTRVTVRGRAVRELSVTRLLTARPCVGLCANAFQQ